MASVIGFLSLVVSKLFRLLFPLLTTCLLFGCEPASKDPISNASTEMAGAIDEDTAVGTAAATVSRSDPGQSPNRRGGLLADKFEEISFEDIVLSMQADVRFRPFMLTDRVKQLDGHRVRISGYMHGGVDQIRGIQEFILLRNKECKFGPGGQADHLVQVFLQDGVTTSYTSEVVVVEGILKIRPFHGNDGFTWSIYELAGTSAKVRR